MKKNLGTWILVLALFVFVIIIISRSIATNQEAKEDEEIYREIAQRRAAGIRI